MRRLASVLAIATYHSICVAADLKLGTLAHERGDYAGAMREWLPLAERGNSEAQRGIGNLYRDGKAVRPDKDEALRWYRLAYVQGDLKAAFEIIQLCESFPADRPNSCAGAQGKAQPDYESISQGIRAVAERGDAEAEFMLSVILHDRLLRARSAQTMRCISEAVPIPDCGPNALDVNRSPAAREANKWLRASVQHGNIRASVHLYLRCNLRSPQDDAAAWGVDKAECSELADQLKKTAKDNIDELSPDDQFAVGDSYLAENPADGVSILVRAAERGSRSSAEELGQLFYDGAEVPRDYSKAAIWYRQFAESTRTTMMTFASVRTACERLGYLYSGVNGVSLDDGAAARWFLRAAGMGSASAQRSIALHYRDGKGVLQSLTEMVRWFRRAAQQGDVESQYMLGEALYFGKGVPQDYVHSHMWFNLAAAAGKLEGIAGRELVARAMSPEQIGQAQSLATNWHAERDPAEIAIADIH